MARVCSAYNAEQSKYFLFWSLPSASVNQKMFSLSDNQKIRCRVELITLSVTTKYDVEIMEPLFCLIFSAPTRKKYVVYCRTKKHVVVYHP